MSNTYGQFITQKNQKSIILFFVFVLSFFFFFVNISHAENTQYCGDNITWIISEEGVLTLSGTGDTDYFPSHSAPWYERRNDIISFVIDGNVNGLRGYVLEDCANLQSISFGYCGDFQNTRIINCPKLTELHITHVNGWSASSMISDCENLTVFLTMDSIQLIPGFRAEGVKFEVEDKTSDFIISNVSGSDGEWRELSYYLGTDSHVTVPDGITRIAHGCFQYLDSLETVVLPLSVKSIESSAFSHCTNLRAINLPEGLSKISSSVFHGCSSIETLELPSTVRRINSSAFAQCSDLKTITIPAATVDIGDGAFQSCNALESVLYSGTEAMKSNITIASDNDPLHTAKWQYDENASEIHQQFFCGDNITWIISEEGVLTLSGTGDTDYFPSHSAPWYEQRNDIISFVIEGNINGLRGYVLEDCANLQSISFGYCGDFQNTRIINCPKLTELHITHVNGWSASSMISDCENLTVFLTMDSIQLIPGFRAEGVKFEVEDKTSDFIISNVSGSDGEWRELSYYLGNDPHVTVPDGITRIAHGCFQYLDSLETVVLPLSVKSIESSAFSHCTNLRAINLPEGLSKISSSVFHSCSSIETLELPSTVRRINSSAFARCSDLKTITIPAATTTIDFDAFSFCNSLKTVIYQGTDKQRAIIDIASNNMPLNEANWIYETTITNWLILPNDLTVIEEETFANCGAEAIVVNDTCQIIKENAFCECSNLIRLYIPAGVKYLADNFIESPSKTTIYCEKNSLTYTWCINHNHTFILGSYN